VHRGVADKEHRLSEASANEKGESGSKGVLHDLMTEPLRPTRMSQAIDLNIDPFEVLEPT
jgi:hypothetical protein